MTYPKSIGPLWPALWLCLSCLFTTASQAAKDVVVNIVSDTDFFRDWRLHLPATEELMDVRGVTVEGQLVGFEGDYLPLYLGENEIRISDGLVEAGTESYFITLQVQETGVTLVRKWLRSREKEIVSWDDPDISLVQGSAGYFRIILKEPVLRPIDGAEIAPAMAGNLKHVRLRISSSPPGSEIYLNNVKIDQHTNIRLSVPYLEGEREKRYLIRNPGLVNCYGAVRLPQTDAEVMCTHRDVR